MMFVVIVLKMMMMMKKRLMLDDNLFKAPNSRYSTLSKSQVSYFHQLLVFKSG